MCLTLKTLKVYFTWVHFFLFKWWFSNLMSNYKTNTNTQNSWMQNKWITQKQNTRFVMHMTYKYEFKKLCINTHSALKSQRLIYLRWREIIFFCKRIQFCTNSTCTLYASSSVFPERETKPILKSRHRKAKLRPVLSKSTDKLLKQIGAFCHIKHAAIKIVLHQRKYDGRKKNFTGK